MLEEEGQRNNGNPLNQSMHLASLDVLQRASAFLLMYAQKSSMRVL
jgi:hypothetical protein